MSSRTRQIDRYDKFRTLFLNFGDRESLRDPTLFAKCFNRRVLLELQQHDIDSLDDLFKYDAPDVKKLFHSNKLFKTAMDALARLCSSMIPNERERFRRGHLHCLIAPFEILERSIDMLADNPIDYGYTEYKGLQKVLSSNGVKTYRDLYEMGIDGLGAMPGLAKAGYLAIANIIAGEDYRLHTDKPSEIPLKQEPREETQPAPVRPTKKKKKAARKKTKSKSKPKKTKPFSLYAIASGKPGKKFTIREFLKITKNAQRKPGGSRTDRKIRLDDGYVYEADSQLEISALRKLIANNAFKRLRGQCINIPYRYGGKDRNYYPDFVLLTQTNKIVIVEIKEVAQMNVKQNLRKYSALKRFCEKNGYLYVMCDARFTPYEKLKKKTVNATVESAIDDAIEEKGYFDRDDYNELVRGRGVRRTKVVRDAIGTYVSSHKGIKMTGDLTHNIANFKIKKVRRNQR